MNWEMIIGIGQILAVALIPIILWGMGIAYQNRKSKRDAKLKLFLTLMANRKGTIISKERGDSLNLIDVVFQDDSKVRKAWRDYLESLNPSSPNFNSSNSYLLDLLSEMSTSLGYKEFKQTDIDRFYEPRQFPNDRNAQERYTEEMIRVLEHSKNLAEGFTQEEYAEHINEEKQ